MARFLFHVYPAVSHCNSTFALAKGLAAAGHDVCYSGVPELLPVAKAAGFEFEVEDISPWKNLLRSPESVRPNAIDRLRQVPRVRRTVARAQLSIERCCAFDELIGRTKPDAVLVDVHYSWEALSLVKLRVPFALLSTKICLDRYPGVPPMTSGIVPGSRASRVMSWLAWCRWDVTNFFTNILWSKSPGLYKRVAKRAGLPPDAIATNRLLGIRIASVPEYILAPPEFDFPRLLATNQRYVGPYVDLERKDFRYDHCYEQQMKVFLEQRTAGRPLVYCAFGSLPWQYAGVRDFVMRLIRSASGARWNLVLALGQSLAPQVRCAETGNCLVFGAVPQLQILKSCDLMITHGGMNSIKECIMCGVPLLVYPGAVDLDQEGNAARVVYHGIGMRGHLRTASSESIRAKVDALLANQRYQHKVQQLAGAVKRSYSFHHGPDIVIKELLGTHSAAST